MSQTVEILIDECSLHWNHLVQSYYVLGVVTAFPDHFVRCSHTYLGTPFPYPFFSTTSLGLSLPNKASTPKL